MALPLLAVKAATLGTAGYGMKKIDDEEKANRKAREDRKAARSGKSGDPRSRGRRKPDSYTDIDPVTGIESSLRTIENARDDARYYSNRKNDYLDKREKGEPYSLAEIQEGNRQKRMHMPPRKWRMVAASTVAPLKAKQEAVWSKEH
jgi:hypothetical protein